MRAVVIGKFHALHRGHYSLVQQAAQVAGITEVVLLSFSGMAAVLGWPPRKPVVALSQRAEIFQQWSADLDVQVHEQQWPFADIRALQAEEFVAKLVDDLAPTHVVVGEDFCFAHRRSANAQDLQRLLAEKNIGCTIAELIGDGTDRWSTTAVRAALADGRVDYAAEILGRPHRVYGTVVHGDGRGRTVGGSNGKPRCGR